MYQAKLIRNMFAGLLFVATLASGSILTAQAQEKGKTPANAKPVVIAGRDPFQPYAPPRPPGKKVVPTATLVAVAVPSIEVRVQQYRAQKLAAMSAHVSAPKPTTALLLGELQVIGITRTPRGYAAIVEATPIKLSYVVYPGEKFYDGQLVAIEDSRLVFRHETVFTDGKHQMSVETKALRQQPPVDAMTAVKPAAASAAPAADEKQPEPKAPTAEKP
jgi:hypothetical protein